MTSCLLIFGKALPIVPLVKPNFFILLLFGLVFNSLLSCQTGIDPHGMSTENYPEQVNHYYDEAFDWRERQVMDSSFIYFDLARAEFLRQNDLFGAGKCLVNMALILIRTEDFHGGQELSLEAIDLFDENDEEQYHHIATNYNNLGSASIRLHEFDYALKYFDQAISFAEDPAERFIYRNNKAKTLEELGRNEEAIVLYEALLIEIASKEQIDSVTLARAQTNAAVTRWKTTSDRNTLVQDLHEALQIRLKKKDLRGLTSSYYHLSRIHQHESKDSSFFYAQAMYDGAIQINNAEDRLYALEQMIATGPLRRTRDYFNEYHRVRDSVRIARDQTKKQFAIIRYEVEKSKNEALRLVQENQRKDFQLKLQYLVIVIVFFLATAFIWMIVYGNRKKRQRQALEAENELQNYQLSTSQKIHDVVANGLYRVMSELENVPVVDREGLLDKLENMYERSRDISYETTLKDEESVGFHEELLKMIRAFYQPDRKIILVGSDASLWTKVSTPIIDELRVILQELLVNMKKHSGATSAMFKFSIEGNLLVINYSDDGVGFLDSWKKGKGLQNTENRIVRLQGHLTFVNKRGSGAALALSIPLD